MRIIRVTRVPFFDIPFIRWPAVLGIIAAWHQVSEYAPAIIIHKAIASDLARDPAQTFRTPRFRHPTAGLVRYTERFDYDPVRQILFVAMDFEPLEGGDAFATPLAHRQFYPREWEALLHYNGFEVVRIDGDFHGGPLKPTSDVMVSFARRRGR